MHNTNSQFKIIDILDKVLEPEFWSIYPERKSYSGHLYHNSPYESDDSCNNCNGARCDNCKEIVIPSDIECSIPVNILEDILTNMNLPRDVVMFFTYDDSCKTKYKGYYFKFPDAKMLKEKYPDKYKELYDKVVKADKLF